MTRVLTFDGVWYQEPGREDALLRDLGFALETGGSLLITGPVGCGKSSVLALALGDLIPNRGEVRVLDRDPSVLEGPPLQSLRASLGVLPAGGGLLSNLTLSENIALPLRYHRHASTAECAAACSRLWSLMDLDEPEDQRAAAAPPHLRTLAGLARALVLDPPLLLLDDPGEGLDRAACEDLWRLIWRLQSELGFAVLATTGDPDTARALTDRTISLPARRHNTFRIVRTQLPGFGDFGVEEA